MRDLPIRLLLHSLLLPLLLFSFFTAFHPLLWMLLPCAASFMAAVALWEYYALAKIQKASPCIPLGILSTIVFLFVIAASGKGFFPSDVLYPLLVAFSGFFLLFLYEMIRPQMAIVSVAITTFGFLYIAVPIGCCLLLNYSPRLLAGASGQFWFAYFLILSKATDVVAYFIGKLYGKRLLCPHLSPKKTWEGAVGALLATTVLSLGFTSFLPEASPFSSATQLLLSLLGGVIVSSLAQFGDLTESLLKRDAGVKNSNALPEIGGALDLIDSLLFSMPAGTLFFYAFSR